MKSTILSKIEQLRFEAENSPNLALKQAQRSSEYKAFKRKVARALNDQFKLMSTKLDIMFPLNKSTYVDDSINSDFISLAYFMSIEEISQYLEYASNLGGAYAVKKIGFKVNFKLTNPELIKNLSNEANLLIQRVDTTTRKEIAKIVSKGFEKGLTNEEIAKELASKTDLRLLRAELIAQAETCNAINKTQKDTFMRNGYTEKMWVTSHDNRVSQGCHDNEAVGWIKMDAEFPSGHDRPPRFPRCRCDLGANRETQLPFTSMWYGQ